MSVTRRIKLLAGFAALLASCVATGCRSTSECCSPGYAMSRERCGCATQGQATATYPGAPVVMEPIRPTAQTQVSRPLMWRTARRGTKEPPKVQHGGRPVLTPDVATQPYQPPQAATMLRPVPIGPTLVDAGTWSPVQRVGAENTGPDVGVSQAVTMERPQPVGPGPLAAMPVEANPTQLVLTDVEKKDNGKAKKGDKDKETLPPPRVNGAKKGQEGWPELPPPMIANPPHAPREFQKHALSAYIIEPPDVLSIEADAKTIGVPGQPISGPHLVRPDGTIGLGALGSVFVAGMTIDQAKMHICEKIRGEQDLTPKEVWQKVKVDVAAFNSKFYYVIADGGGYGESVVPVPCTGNETVLDAIGKIQGLPAVASKKQIWVARATPHGQTPTVLPVDWCSIVQGGSAHTNYQIFPGDRVYVNSQKLIRIDSKLAKIISPIERLLGITLLGSTTVNSIQGNQGFGNNNVGR